MSDLHSETTTPRTLDAHGRPVGPPNDQTALNGGSIRHMYRPDAAERIRPWFTGQRVATGLAVFGGLFVGVALLAGLA